MKRILILLAAVLCLTACHDPEKEARERQVVLVYFAGNNSLSAEGVDDFTSLKASWLPKEKDRSHILLVYRHFTDQTPTLMRLYKDRNGNTVEQIIREYSFDSNSADSRTLASVLADAEEAWPSASHGLILWSHASGFLPPGYYSDPKEQADGASLLSFAVDRGEEMDLTELRQALSKQHHAFIIFDCCLMANVEVAYELKDVTDYVGFSQAEVLAEGFDYLNLADRLLGGDSADPLAVCKDYFAQYENAGSSESFATISLVETSQMEQLSRVCATLFDRYNGELATMSGSGVQGYFRFGRHFFYDLEDIMIHAGATDDELATLRAAMDKAIVYKAATDKFISFDINVFSGLSMYLPSMGTDYLDDFYRSEVSWNDATALVR